MVGGSSLFRLSSATSRQWLSPCRRRVLTARSRLKHRHSLHRQSTQAPVTLHGYCPNQNMANTMPIPLPPRTPTPPPDEPDSPQKLPTFDPNAPFDPNSLSPHQCEADQMPSSGASYFAPSTPEKQGGGGNGTGAGPFNFEPSTLAKSPLIKSVRCPPETF